jgi:hypothetical protein
VDYHAEPLDGLFERLQEPLPIRDVAVDVPSLIAACRDVTW